MKIPKNIRGPHKMPS